MQNEINFDDQRFREILDKIIELFSEFGIRNLNMDDISRNLRISKKTLYQYVKSKEDLIEKLFYYDQVKWEDEFAKIKVEELNAIEILFTASLLVAEEMNRISPKVRFELKKYYEPAFNKFMVAKQQNIFIHMVRNMEKGIMEGLYRSDLNIDMIANLYVKTLITMHNKDYCVMQDISSEELFKVLFESHIRAISTPEGIAFFEKRKAEIQEQNRNNNS